MELTEYDIYEPEAFSIIYLDYRARGCVAVLFVKYLK